jgi:tetratricopeptide (TPR) repeat protein
MILRRIPLGIVVAAAALLVHSGALRGTFHYDDENVILLNRARLQDAGSVLEMFRDPSVFSGIPGNPLFRPVAHATHVLDAHLGTWGPERPDPFPFHLTNLLLHAGAAFVLYHLLRRLLRTLEPGGPAGPRVPPAAEVAAFLGSLWFALQPVNSEVVNYVSARSESLAALFFLLSLLAHHAAWEDGVAAGRRRLLVAASALAALLSFGSKETGVLLPAVAGALEVWGRPGAAPPGARVRNGVLRSIPLLLALGAYLSLRAAAMPGAPSEAWAWKALAGVGAVGALAWGASRALDRLGERIRPGAAAAAAFALVLAGGLALAVASGGEDGVDPLLGGGRSTAAHLLTQCRVAAAYALLVLFPADLAPDHGVRVAASLDPATVLALLGLSLAAALVVRSAARGRRAAPLIASWAFLAAAPSILVPLNVVMNEHRLYLPSTALALGAGLVLLGLLRAAARVGAHPAGVAAATAVFCVFAAVDADRARNWADPRALWSRAVAASPGSWRNHMHLGVEAYRVAQKRFEGLEGRWGSTDPGTAFMEREATDFLDFALEEFVLAHALYPGAFETRLNLGFAHLYRGNLLNRGADPAGPPPFPEPYLEAARWFTLAEKASPDSWRALYNRATAIGKAGRVHEAIVEFERLAQDKSRTTIYAWALSDLYSRARRPDEALRQVDLIDSIAPGDLPQSVLRRVDILLRARRLDEADRALARAWEVLGRADSRVWVRMARLLVAGGRSGDLPRAREAWAEALRLGHKPGAADRALVMALGE